MGTSLIMRLLIYLPIFLFLLSASCNNDDNTVPPITEENTFSCKIDGELFVPNDYGGFPITQHGINARISNNNWTIILSNGSIDIYLYLANLQEVGNYELSLSDGNADFLGETENAAEVDLENITGTSHISTNVSGSIQVLEIEPKQKTVMKFDKITLVDKEKPEDIIILSEGKLNINLETLDTAN